MDNNTLYHYGVLGMKWGRRKSRSGSGNTHADYKRAHSKTSVKNMSDKELQQINNRLQAEANYKRLTQKTGKGEKLVKSFIATAGTIVAVQGAYKTYKGLGDSAIDKIGDWVVSSIKF